MAEFLFYERGCPRILQEFLPSPFYVPRSAALEFKRCAIPFKRHKRIAGRDPLQPDRNGNFRDPGILSSSTLFLRLPFSFYLFGWLGLSAWALGYALTTRCGSQCARSCCLPRMWRDGGFTALYVARTYKNGLQRAECFLLMKRKVFCRPKRASGGGTIDTLASGHQKWPAYATSRRLKERRGPRTLARCAESSPTTWFIRKRVTP